MVSMGKDIASLFEVETEPLVRQFPMTNSLVRIIKKNVIKFVEHIIICAHNRIRRDG